MFNRNEIILYQLGYRVTPDGVVLKPNGISIECYNTNGGYREICKKQGISKLKCRVHRLQAYQKYGNLIYKQEYQIRHLNNNKQDNSYENISIGTSSQNMMDCPKEDRINRSKYAASFLKRHDEEAIKEYYKTNRSYKNIMNEFNISSKGTLHAILNRK